MKTIKLADYHYKLPDEKIATHGIAQRDSSKLLVSKNDSIFSTTFSQLANNIPVNATLFFNNTKVIQARLLLKRETGAIIEVFLLSPANKNLSIQDTLSNTKSAIYSCMIGNLKKWHPDEILTQEIQINSFNFTLKARLVSKENKTVEFTWDSDTTFGRIIETIGHTPLPPYLNRKDEIEDITRYQTIYSKFPGAVAAPTAGLHFTDDVLASLGKKGIKSHELTLHVSAGTFQPIKEEMVTNHPMHSEQIIVYKTTLQAILDTGYVIAVGTTAMRTLESTYWYGVQLILQNDSNFQIKKMVPYTYEKKELPSLREAIGEIIKYMNINNLEEIVGHTEIFIMPGYSFRVCKGLITNFHQPGSTLILLVAAFLGDKWRKIYDYALENDYKFLSYGDSSLLLT